jgi:DNA polymerase III sliding clamp (beta) subunit (PCNA family)
VLDDEIDLSVFFTDKEQGYIVARGMSFELVSKLIPCPYPDIEKAIPKKMPFAFSIEREPFLDTVKKAELYANKKNRMTELSPGKKENELSIIVKDMDEGVEFSEQILAKMLTKPKWNGIAFNAKSMSAILSDAPGRMLTLKAGEKQISAITIEPTGHDELYFLLMPLRKTDDGHTEAENQDARDKKENVSSQNSTGTKNPKEAESKKPVS